ncbi:MAG: phosphatase PAP2 family protein [Ruminiclostridium sp.]|nr:phosphatase PAP2 family protein [Ruminiclostridium sp.]
MICAFIIWTILIQIVDVKPIGQDETKTGFALLNSCFHKITGVNLSLYHVTDWLGLIPIVFCLIFGITGFIQLIRRKNLFKVDYFVTLSGIYYIIIILLYLLFEMIPINYRPVLISGVMESSYPSSTTLLVASVMPSVSLLIKRRIKAEFIRRFTDVSVTIFILFVVIGRTLSGVHWITDIIGAVLLSAGLFLIYKWIILFMDERRLNRGIQ